MTRPVDCCAGGAKASTLDRRSIERRLETHFASASRSTALYTSHAPLPAAAHPSQTIYSEHCVWHAAPSGCCALARIIGRALVSTHCPSTLHPTTTPSAPQQRRANFSEPQSPVTRRFGGQEEDRDAVLRRVASSALEELCGQRLQANQTPGDSQPT